MFMYFEALNMGVFMWAAVRDRMNGWPRTMPDELGLPRHIVHGSEFCWKNIQTGIRLKKESGI